MYVERWPGLRVAVGPPGGWGRQAANNARKGRGGEGSVAARLVEVRDSASPSGRLLPCFRRGAIKPADSRESFAVVHRRPHGRLSLSGEGEVVTMKQEGEQLGSAGGMGTSPSLKGLVEVALEIARRRREALWRLRKALDAGNEREALKLARELCGLHEKSDRAHQSVN